MTAGDYEKYPGGARALSRPAERGCMSYICPQRSRQEGDARADRRRPRSTTCSAASPTASGSAGISTCPRPSPSRSSSGTIEADRPDERRIGPYLSFLGGGAYDHFIPTVVDYLSSRGEFVTPLHALPARGQPGDAPGHLRVPDPDLPADRAGHRQRLPLRRRHGRGRGRPHGPAAHRPDQGPRRPVAPSRSTGRSIRTYIKNLGLEPSRSRLRRPGGRSTRPRSAELGRRRRRRPSSVQSPNFFGVVEDVEPLSDAAHGAQGPVLVAVVAEAVSLGAPRSARASSAPTSSRARPSRSACPLSFGGPYLGFMACKKEFLRQMPGRIVGQTKDVDGRRGFVLTLSTREQHIRREKATSNICTQPGLVRPAGDDLPGDAWASRACGRWPGRTSRRRPTPPTAWPPSPASGSVSAADLQRVRPRASQGRWPAVDAAPGQGHPRPGCGLGAGLSRAPNDAPRLRDRDPDQGRDRSAWPAALKEVRPMNPRTAHFRDQRHGQSAAVALPALDVPRAQGLLAGLSRPRTTSPTFPEVSEVEVVRHFTRLSQKNYCVDLGLLPARLLHDEVQPQDQREDRRPAGFPGRPSARARGTGPGQPRGPATGSRTISARSPAWTPSPSSPRPGPTASSPG